MAHYLSKGMHWIGHPGSLHPIIDFGEESVTDDIAQSVEVDMDGTRHVRVARHRPLRSWRLAVPDAHADQLAPLRALLTATLPPYVLITADAQVSNVLTPERSVMSDLITPSALGLAGAWVKEDGTWATITRTNPSAMFGALGLVRIGPAPVPPTFTGRPVTISCQLATARTAGAYVILDWLDAAGAQVGAGVDGVAVAGMDMLRRSSVTATPPAGAVALRIGVAYAEVLAEPQVTWTGAVIPEWTVGNGADQVVPTDHSRSTSMAVPDSRSLRRSSHDISLMEVGP